MKKCRNTANVRQVWLLGRGNTTLLFLKEGGQEGGIKVGNLQKPSGSIPAKKGMSSDSVKQGHAVGVAKPL